MEVLKVSMETRGMAWLRYKKKCLIVTTESGRPLNGDVVGYDGKHIYEIEIKKSFSDFKADFRKTRKHQNMATEKGMANYFTYLVVPEIANKCLELLQDYPKYGLMIPDEEHHWVSCNILKPTLRIHNRSPHPTRLKDLQLRMASEQMAMRLGMESINGAFTGIVNELRRKDEEIFGEPEVVEVDQAGDGTIDEVLY